MMACSSTMGGCPFTVITYPLAAMCGALTTPLLDAFRRHSCFSRGTWETSRRNRPARMGYGPRLGGRGPWLLAGLLGAAGGRPVVGVAGALAALAGAVA